jgi:hypothetical protein
VRRGVPATQLIRRARVVVAVVRLIVAVLAVLLVSVTAGAQEPGEGQAPAGAVLYDGDSPARVSAYGRWAVWSEWDAKHRRAHLVASRDGGAPRRLPVRSATQSFDADVGPDRRGRATVVYSRCQRSYVRVIGPRGYGCDIYRHRLGSDGEREVTGASRATSSETRPAIWGDAIAFVRNFERRSGIAGVRPHLVLRRRGKERPLRGGYRLWWEGLRYRGGRNPREPRSATGIPQGVFSIDLREGLVAVEWVSAPGGPCDFAEDDDSKSDWEVSQILLATTSRTRTLAHGCSAGDTTRVSDPQLLDGAVQHLADDASRRFDTAIVQRGLESGAVTSIDYEPAVTDVARSANGFFLLHVESSPDASERWRIFFQSDAA